MNDWLSIERSETMGQNDPSKIRVIELTKEDASSLKLEYRYVAEDYYDVSTFCKAGSWEISLTLRSFEKPLEKLHWGTLFEDHVQETRVFTAVLDGEQVGWIELGYEKWNNRMRVWEFVVKDRFRRLGIGSTLMKCGVGVARQRGARMLVLETQSCNTQAIGFYLKQGFKLIGFDLAAYSNEDVEKKEVRLEFGLTL